VTRYLAPPFPKVDKVDYNKHKIYIFFMIYVEVELFFDENERESGEGYFPVIKRSYGMISIKETFFLNRSGCWIQQNTHKLENNAVDKLFAQSMDKYISIQGLYNGKNLLDLLNSQVTTDTKGDSITNNLGKQLYPIKNKIEDYWTKISKSKTHHP